MLLICAYDFLHQRVAYHVALVEVHEPNLLDSAQHLHGGMGVDRDYPLHRYFLWAKKLELTLGGATQQLLKIGKTLADEPVPA